MQVQKTTYSNLQTVVILNDKFRDRKIRQYFKELDISFNSSKKVNSVFDYCTYHRDILLELNSVRFVTQL